MKRIAVVCLSLLFCFLASADETIDNPNFRKTKSFPISYNGELSDVANVFSSISTLKGIQYYSNTRSRWEILYKEAGFINNPIEKRFIPDAQVTVRPNTNYYCLLEDNSLGDFVLKVNYIEKTNQVIADFVLVEPVKIWGITGIQSNDLHIQLKASKTQGKNVIDAEIVIEARYKEISYIEDLIPKSLDARLDALYRWMTNAVQKK